jgi:hypothetical protein
MWSKKIKKLKKTNPGLFFILFLKNTYKQKTLQLFFFFVFLGLSLMLRKPQN